MITSVIQKQQLLHELFSKYPIEEVFAKEPFSFEDMRPTLFVIIPKDCFNWYDLWIECTQCYPYGLLISMTRDYTDPILKDTQLIWRGGMWLV